ncbi:hypothetical protein I3760_05G162000 [Carya illinoinensis]|nr:hypothetical protein I3760_05G162000 [Carya illinoinensis]
MKNLPDPPIPWAPMKYRTLYESTLANQIILRSCLEYSRGRRNSSEARTFRKGSGDDLLIIRVVSVALVGDFCPLFVNVGKRREDLKRINCSRSGQVF